jgi:hypothetical protein
MVRATVVLEQLENEAVKGKLATARYRQEITELERRLENRFSSASNHSTCQGSI